MMVVKGRPYRCGPLGRLEIDTLRRVKDEFGLRWTQVLEYMDGVNDETPLMEVLCDIEWSAWMFAWMVNAGDEVTVDDIKALRVEDIVFTRDLPDDDRDAPDDESPDPTTASDLADTDQAADAEAPPAGATSSRKKSSTTSKKPSTRGSH